MLQPANASETFTLHDGPPFANGTVHMGHALNKVLKDVASRYQLSQGKAVSFRPGFDCHGLPTELKVLQSLSAQERENLTPLELRQRCRDYALAAVEQQKASFKRLGVLADWDNAYLTMQPSYEAAQLEALAQLLEQGYLFRAERLVYWSPSSQTTLADAELVYAPEDLTQSQPLDWRTHEPVETRTMTQWFLDLNRMRSQALQVVDDVDWGNEAAKTRFVSMLGDRPDWCVSRQRVWGLPLPAFYHSETNEVLMTPETVRHFAALVQLHGSDCWWTMPTSELLPASEQADAALYRTGSDTLDVWLDSGLSWAAALNGEASDLVLEGSDQHRGWFQSSLLTAAALTGKAPFKTVLTHGFVLDEGGRKMSKSEGNTLDPLDVVNQYSADVLRLWAVAGNYHQDLRVGDASLLQAQDSYLKFRRTLRFMLANLFDFDATSQPALLPEDQAALDQLAELRSQVQAAYESHDFNEALRLLQNYAAQNLSRDWFGTETTGLKARLYLCYEGAADSSDRRSGQSALYQACQTLTALLEPMVPHLAQEVRNQR